MGRKLYRVTPDSGEWTLMHAGLRVYSHASKTLVVSIGHSTASANRPSHLMVHRSDGRFECDFTYGDDPELERERSPSAVMAAAWLERRT